MHPKNGGPGQGIRHSITEMTKRGIVNDVVCLDSPVEDYLTDKIDKFTIYALGPVKTAWQYSKALLPWLDENLHNYDVVIVHGLWLYHGYAGYKAIRKINTRSATTTGNPKRIKFFVMPHGMLDPYFQKAGSRRLKAIRNFFYWYLIECKVVHFADGVLFTSQSELELARQTFSYYSPKREINVGYGIPVPPPCNHESVSVFRHTIAGLGDRPYLLFLSRIHEKKGLDLLIEAYKYQLQNNKRDTINTGEDLPCLVIAGPGWDEPYGQSISSAILAEPLFSNRVFITGMISGNTKWGAFKGADAFLLPSHQENFGIAVAEALAFGKPVLITKQVNIWQEIEMDGAGIVKNDTIQGIRDLLGEWLGLHNDERAAMCEKAFTCFKNRYDIYQPTDNLLNAIK